MEKDKLSFFSLRDEQLLQSESWTQPLQVEATHENCSGLWKNKIKVSSFSKIISSKVN